MLTALAAAGPVAHSVGFGFWWVPALFSLLWIGLLVTIVVLLVRRGRRGPWGPGWQGGPPWGAHHATRSAEATLAERFANGDIDEKEYRARLEVLRANGPVPPSA